MVLLLLAERPAAATDCVVATLSPNSGPAGGGTLVNLTGTALGDGSAWRCSFGDSLVGAEYHDDNECVSCYSPSSEDAGVVAVNVSVDGGSTFCAGAPLSFRVYPPPTVKAISPASGSAEGGTVVTVTGSGFDALGGSVVCTFGSLRVGDTIVAGAQAAATNITNSTMVCASPSADEAAAVGIASFTFRSMPPKEVVTPCSLDMSDCKYNVEPERLYAYPSGHNITLLGDAVAESNVIKLTRNLFQQRGAMKLALYNPGAPAGVPVREFDASWEQSVGRGSGADGYSFVYGNLTEVRTPFGEMGIGDGLVVRFRTRGLLGNLNEGHGMIEVLYNHTVLKETFMGDKLRDFYRTARAVRVVKDVAGLSVSFGGEVVLTTTIEGWDPRVDWNFGFGGRTGDRKDDHWIDQLTVQSGFLLDSGTVAFGVSLNGGHDVSLLEAPSVFTYTTKPAVFAFSPTTGPERGDTLVTVEGSHFAGGSDYRCRFGGEAEMNVQASYDNVSRALMCHSPPAVGGAQLVLLEVSLNDRPLSTSTSGLPFRFFRHPSLLDARGPSKVAAPAGVGANVSLLGANFTGGDDYRAVFVRSGVEPSASEVVNATYVNDTLILCEAPPSFSQGAAEVALSLNGQQYTAVNSFPFFTVHSLSPTTGPTLGGTLVTVNGSAFDVGGAYRCRFGNASDAVVEASRLNDEQLECHSPLVPDDFAFPLEVALNARDFSAANVVFSYFSHPNLVALPASGPRGGETLVAFQSAAAQGLAGGSDYRCSFGAHVVPATYVQSALATLSPRGPHNHKELLQAHQAALSAPWHSTEKPQGAVLCVSPPNMNLSSEVGSVRVPLAVTLNGLDYIPETAGFTYFMPPNVTALSPTRGPTAGGTVVTFVVEPMHDELVNTTACRVGGPGYELPLVHSRPVLAQLSPASVLGPNLIQCAVPPANRTGAFGQRRLHFSSNAALGGLLFGDASISVDRHRPCELGEYFSCGGDRSDAYVHASSTQCEWLCPIQDGLLRLTGRSPHSSGSFIADMPLVPLAPPGLELNATFELLIGRYHGDDIGMAPYGSGVFTINFGQLPLENFGIVGATRGLAVQIFISEDDSKVEVWLQSKKLYVTPFSGGVRVGAWVPCHMEVSQGAVSFSVGRTRLVDKLALPDWSPEPTWRFGVSGSTSKLLDDYWVDTLVLSSTLFVEVEERPIEITLNGQQYVSIAAGSASAFGYYGATAFPSLLSISPSSGPIEGGTILRLATEAVDSSLALIPEDPWTLTAPARSSSAYRCFLGAQNLSASFANETIRCATLPFELAAGQGLPLRFSVNAQDAAGPVATFVLYATPSITTAVPLSGPARGGTLVTLTGTSLVNGSDLRCRFGNGSLVDETPGVDVVHATYDAGLGALLCASPPAIGHATGPQQLYVSLNSQNYVLARGLLFYYTSPLAPLFISPTSGPSDGETSVTITTASDVTGADVARCRFADAVVPAVASGSALLCDTPPAALVPALARLQLLHGNESTLPPSWMYGDAHLADGALQLTTGLPSSAGSFVVPRDALNVTDRGFESFRIRLKLTVNGGVGGDGFSVSYGKLPRGKIGEYGGGLGLRVCFLTAKDCSLPFNDAEPCPAMEVYYATHLLWSVPLRESFRRAVDTSLVVEYSAAGLHVTHGEIEYVPRHSLHIPRWMPTPEWEFGFGARSGLQTDLHSMRDLEMRVGSLIAAAPVPVYVSLNAQQYEPLPALVRTPYRDRSYTYFGAPALTVLSPASGPVLGGSPAVMLAGGGMGSFATVQGGSDYRCRFGSGPYDYVTAYVNETADEVYCIAPAGAAAATLDVAVSLNGQQYHTSSQPYARLDSVASAKLASASPTSGPVRGSTLVTITASPTASLAGGDDYRCRFATTSLTNDTRTTVDAAEQAGQVTNGTYDPGTDSVQCLSPPVVSAAAAANFTLQLAPNALHYEAVSPFEYYDDPSISSLSPSSGPTTGGTLVVVTGQGLRVGSHNQCWLGDGRSAANRTAVQPIVLKDPGASSLHCYAPSSALASSTKLRLALNGQQASFDSQYTYYDTPWLQAVHPSYGDAGTDGTPTLIEVAAMEGGHSFANGTDYRCRFGASSIAARPATRVAEDTLRCHAPRDAAVADVEFRVSLNGQQYGPSLAFEFLAPPRVLALEPNSGSFDGGTLVTIIGENFANRSLLTCKFGPLESTAVPATFVSATHAQCLSPHGDDAELVGTWSAEFTDGVAPPRTLLLGDAVLQDGGLMLTETVIHQVGGFVIEPTTRGARYFSAQFSALIGGGGGGDGLSFCYGELSHTEPFGETGAAGGLCVRLRTMLNPTAEVTFNGTVLASVRVGSGLRSESFMMATFARMPGQGVRATLEAGNDPALAELVVEEVELISQGYAPTPTWRFGFGARSGQDADRHIINSVVLTGASFVSSSGVGLRVANNGQQFSAASAPYEFYASPEVSSISPSSGPLRGGTRVVIHGAHLGHGHGMRCHFPQLEEAPLAVNASRVAEHALACLSPPTSQPVHAPLEVSLNGQQFTSSSILYDTLEPASISIASPSCGPTDGGTLVNVTGVGISGGSDLHCRFSTSGQTIVGASRASGGSSIKCTAPPRPLGSHNLSVAANGQQFSPPAAFGFFAPPVVSKSTPSSGPTSGGTVVVVQGSNLASTSGCHVVCRFGDLLTPGSPSAEAGTVTCETPPNPAALGESLQLFVSLNRQQFSAGEAIFTYTSVAPLEDATPNSGPIAGGTQVTVHAPGLVGGDDYTCRWSIPGQSHVVNATYVAGEDGLVACSAPSVNAAGSYNLSVSLNRQDYRTPLPYAFYKTRPLTMVSPASGPADGGAPLTIVGANLANGTNYTCLLRVVGSEVAPLVFNATYDAGDDSVRCTTPRAPELLAHLLQLYVAPNGQQYEASPLDFEMYAPPPQFEILPSSGPAAGGTNVTVVPVAGASSDSCPLYANDGVCDEPWVCASGTDCSDCAELYGSACGLLAGSDARCRFSGQDAAGSNSSATAATVAASVVGSSLSCISPPTTLENATLGTPTHVVDISLNGRQYTGQRASYTFYEPPVVSYARPLGGPADGGTRILVSGSRLKGGSDYICELRLRDSPVLLAATYEAANGTVECTTTALLDNGTYALSVRPNGQNAAHASDVNFVVFPAPQPTAIIPSSGPLLGNTTVRVSGSALLGSGATIEARCRFGMIDVPATLDSRGSATCVSPTAQEAGAVASMSLDFTDHVFLDVADAEPPYTRMSTTGLTLLGDARLMPTGHYEPFKFVRLTQSAYKGPGACLLPPNPSPSAGPSPWFRASADVRFWGSGSAHGMSFCYGDLPHQAWGEDGASLGLCVLFDTPKNTVRVRLDGQIVHDVPAALPLRDREWRELVVVSTLRGLRAELHGTTLFEELPLPGTFSPSARWRFGFGARTGPNIGQHEERHDVRGFAAVLGAPISPHRVGAHLSLNGQQFVGSLLFDYYPLASPTDVVPLSGPAEGGTMVTVSGTNLLGGSDYRCRFSRADGSVRVQQAALVGGAVQCVAADSPMSSDAMEVLTISLNGQQYTLSEVPPLLNFSVEIKPEVTGVAPSFGPTDGGTLVSLSLPQLGEAANHTCRFNLSAVGLGLVTAPATADSTGSTSVSCRAPRLPDGQVYHVAPLDYSLNGQQYTSDEHLFTYYRMPILSWASPASGPLAGGTLVSVRGRDIWGPGSERVCDFGGSRSLASRAAPGEVVCKTPAMAATGALPQSVPVRVSLNAQQFSELPAPMTLYKPLAISTASPNCGPAMGGGTLIEVRGDGIVAGGSDMKCAFSGLDGLRRAETPASHLGPGKLGCTSPPDLAAQGELAAESDGAVRLELAISLNGQQFSNGSAFRAYLPRNVTAVVPRTGIFEGGTLVNLSLAAQTLHMHAVNNALGVNASTMRCRFGDAVVAASLDEGRAHALCTSPSSLAAGALPVLAEEFEAVPAGAKLFGTAQIREGVLELTSKEGRGSFVLPLPNVGGSMGGSRLVVSFDLLLGTGGGADGVSIVYGPTPDYAFPETGTGSKASQLSLLDGRMESQGLEIWIRTGLVDHIQIAHLGTVYTMTPMKGTLRTNAFLNGTVEVSAAGFVDVRLGAGALRQYQQLPDWSPKRDWAIGFGGRCSRFCDAPENAQWLDNLVVRSEALLQTYRVPLDLSLNGQQYFGGEAFSYNAPVHLSSVTPAGGPTSGGTRITLTGSNLEGGAPGEYACRLGSQEQGWSLVAGTMMELAAAHSYVTCETPEASMSRTHVVDLGASNNMVEFAANGATPYTYYAHPNVAVVTPTGGPTSGGTLLRVYGSHLHGGFGGKRRCRIDGLTTAATLDTASGALLCYTPAAASPLSQSHPLYISLNGEHFTRDAPSFSYYPPTVLDSSTPISGHSNGTSIVLRGSGLWREGATQCRVGNALTNASAVAGGSVGDAVVCPAPAAALAGAWSRVALAFSEPWASQLYEFEAELRGLAKVGDGYLHLLDYHNASFFPIPINAVGSLVLALPQPALPLPHFRATFQLRMGRGSGADGFSFSYGDLPHGGIGELGAGSGLRVCFRTYTHERLEVCGGRSDDHHVDNLLIEAGSAVTPTRARVGLTLNGLQFDMQPPLWFEYQVETAKEAGFAQR